MPTAPPRPCPNAPRGCRNLITGRGPCAPCRTAADAQRGSSAARGYGATWRATRARILERDPVCTVDACGPSVDVDHVKAKEQGGTDADDNLRGVAHGCHSRKTVLLDGGFGRPRQAHGVATPRPAVAK